MEFAYPSRRVARGPRNGEDQSGTCTMHDTYLIIDPQHEYALALMDVIERTYGMKPVCLYLDSRAEVYKRRYFPQLTLDRVEASYFLDQTSIPELAHRLQRHHRIVGVLPYFE